MRCPQRPLIRACLCLWVAPALQAQGSGPPEVRGVSIVEESAPDLRHYSRQWAVLIGVDEYPEQSGLSPLQFAVNDASGMREVLVDDFGYEPEQVFLLVNGEATREAVLGILDRLNGQEGAGTDDSLLFFFAGHGLIGKSEEGYLATSDSRIRPRAL